MAFLKNVRAFKILTGGLTIEGIADAISQHPHRDLAPHEARHTGWADISGSGELFAGQIPSIPGAALVSLVVSMKKLPPSAVSDRLNAECQEKEELQGFPVRRREKVALKSDIIDQMLPDAFTVTKRIDAIIDIDGGRIYIDSASEKGAESVIDALRYALGSLKAAPLPVLPVHRQLAEWAADSSTMPDGLLPGRYIEAEDKEGGIIRANNADLGSQHLHSVTTGGLSVRKLGIQVDGGPSFVLCQDLSIRKFLHSDETLDDAINFDDQGIKHDRILFEACLSLTVLRDLFEMLIDAAGGEHEFNGLSEE